MIRKTIEEALKFKVIPPDFSQPKRIAKGLKLKKTVFDMKNSFTIANRQVRKEELELVRQMIIDGFSNEEIIELVPNRRAGLNKLRKDLIKKNYV